MAGPAWLEVSGWLRAAEIPLEVLPPDLERRDAVLEEVGVSRSSAVGSIIGRRAVS